MNNLNCHVEPKRQLRAETSQPLHISPRDIAEDAKLNHEIAEELKNHISLSCQCQTLASRWLRNPYLTWILRSSRSMIRMYVLLSIITLLPTFAHAETCTATPDCKTLGYTETSCPDGSGVKCPWNTNLMYCCKKCEDKDPCLSCKRGCILNSDMTCSTDKVNGKTPIGVVLQQTIITTTDTEIKYQGIAAALEDLKDSVDRNAANSSYSYSVDGITGWRLPTKEELSAIRNYIGNIDDGFTKAGGTTFKHKNYWTSNNDDGQSWVANPFTGKTDTLYYYGSANVRPVLDLSGLL